jgi:putative colanic acid biosynthesis UDP-glucose lipid carrier transferase
MPKPSTLSATEARRLLIGALRIADVAVVCGAGCAAYWLRHGLVEVPKLYLVAIILGAVLSSGYLHSARAYTFETLRQTALQLGAVAGCWISVFGTLLLFAYSIKISDEISRVWALSWFAIGMAGFAAARLALLLQVARWVRRGVLTLNIAVVGAGELGQRLIRFVESQKDAGVRLVGVYDDRRTRVPRRVGGQIVLGTVDDLIHRLREQKVDEIIVALPWRAEAHLAQILDKLKSVAAEVRLCPEAVAFELPNLGYATVLGIPMLRILERPLTGWSTIAKGLEDRVLAGLLLSILSPVLLLIALAIAVDSPGPVLFRQKRYGFNNNEFLVLKFRTMRALAAADGAVVQARENDPRVTRVGRVLRRTSLDELPQLFNVLSGEMSLVGPRPHAVPHNIKYAGLFDGYLRRHRMKPGITGWAQVRGFRGEIQSPEDMRLRVQHDLYYIEHWSLLFDLKILFLTLLTGFAHRKAY